MDEALRADEAARLAARRAQVGVAADAPVVGLALSGGGIRSATFCLGLLRGLAQRGQLPRIDYLSTVSGGGYCGGMFGRLVSLAGLAGAQTLLAANDSPVLGWLRRNGRYLTPSGSRDVGIAIVSYLRAFLAIHGEFMFVCIPFALLVMAPHLWQSALGPEFSPAAWQPWFTLWWPIAVALWLAVAPGLMAGYWIARDSADPGQRRVALPWRDAAFVVLLCALLAGVWLGARPPLPGRSAALRPAALVLITVSSCAVGLVGAHLRLVLTSETASLAVARLRHRLTFALRSVTLAAGAMLLFGALDLASWQVLVALGTGERWVWGGIGIGGVTVLVLRTLAQPLLQLSERAQPNSLRAFGPKLVNLAGLVGVAVLACAWLVLMQWLVFAPRPVAWLAPLAPITRAAVMLSVCAAWLVLTAGNEQMANASSLHSFYRARLTRAYLAVGNAARGIVPRVRQIRAADDIEVEAEARQDVTEVVPGDDTGLLSYRPETAGGPIHLINACLNQTHDDASGLFNADRKGTLVTATWRGFEIGPERWIPIDDTGGADTGTLGRWIAVSGAAAAPGAGSYTSRGWAALLYFLGVRLGYWMRAPQPAPEGFRGWLWTRVVKPVMLWSEGTAAFFGPSRPWWYLSDGGHFENTGVYPLLKRRCEFIVAADCGADGEYDFGDIENLVRKARIDLGAEIEFYTRDEAARLFTLSSSDLTVLSPEQMADNHSARGVLLARVRYPAAPGRPASEATLLVIKPNLHDALDVDLLAYAQRRASFPHESTGDQSFDEAQWESYQRLGEDFGRHLNEAWLCQLPGWLRVAHHPLTVAARLHGAVAPANASKLPLWRRSARATAIGATLGIGASGTLLLSVWQLQETVQQNRINERAELRDLFVSASSKLEDFKGSCPVLAEHTAVQVRMLSDLREHPGFLPLERAGIARLVERIREECQRPMPPDGTPECRAARERIDNGLCGELLRPVPIDTALNYWAPTTSGLRLAQLPGHLFVQLSTPAPTRSAAVPPPPPASGAVPAPDLAQRTELMQAEIVRACAGPTPLAVYIQVYDEASRRPARGLRQALQRLDGLNVPPVENVGRSAELRGVRKPVPWPVPTLVVHQDDAASAACARALQSMVQARLESVDAALRTERNDAAPAEVWIRPLPEVLQRTGDARVIELWLPPSSSGLGELVAINATP